jgi:uncharacterized protein DUF6893
MVGRLVKKALLIGMLALVGNLVARSVPDVSRYLKMRSM